MAFCTIKMSEERRRKNLESTILVWLTHKSDQIKLDQLRHVIDYVQIFNNTELCHEYLEQIVDDDQIYLITDIPYISKRKEKVYNYQTDENFNEVVQAVQTDHQNQMNPFGMNIFQQSSHSSLNSEFLWFQRILAVLLDGDDREKARNNLLVAYKRYFDGNRHKEEKIRLFETTYQSNDALQWYTRECFFFEVLNKALRTQDIDVLYSLRFFLKDMYDQLKIEYDKRSHTMDLLVFRGQILCSNELETIRENIGQFISLNSFISTTIEEQTAQGFSLSGDSTGERVFFRIQVKTTISNPKPFADISLRSQFTNENEVLFMAGSIFQIQSTTFSPTLQMWMIDLQLCDDNVYELYDVYQSDRTIVTEQKSPFSFAAILLRMNLYDKAKKYYQQLLDEGSINDIPSIDLIVNCYWGLSNVNRQQGDLDIALAYQSLAIEHVQNRPDLLLQTYKYMSFAYLDMHSLNEAIEYQTKALEIQTNINHAKDQIADTLYNFGVIYLNQLRPEIDRALEYFYQSMEMYKELNMHLDLIRCYDAIGQIYLDKKQKHKALDSHRQALQLIEEYFPSYLPYRISSYEYIARVYQSMGDYEQAMKYYNEVLNEKLKYEPSNHPNIAESYEAIGGVYHKKGEYDKAIEMYDRSIELRRRIHEENHPHLESIVSTRNCLQTFVE